MDAAGWPLTVPSHNGRWHSKGDAPDGIVGRGPRCHFDAVNDGADAEAEGAASAVRGDVWEVSDGIKCDGLVAAVVAGHVALATVDAHVLVNHRHHLLLVVKVTIGPNHGDGSSNHVLEELKEQVDGVTNRHTHRQHTCLYACTHTRTHHHHTTHTHAHTHAHNRHTTHTHAHTVPTLTVGMGLPGARAGRCTSAGNASTGATECLCSARILLLLVR